MATLSTIPGIHSLVKKLIVQDRKSHKHVSDILKRRYPTWRGLSPRSVRRFCETFNIHATSRISDYDLDASVRRCITRVGSSYGRRMMTGLLSFEGTRVSQLRVGQALQRVNPRHHHHRQTRMHRLTNPISYRSEYFGEKLHIDQNEKLVMFGVTHVCAVDGHSGRIVGFVTMPIKNNITVYECLYMKLIQDYGLWTQLRVDKGKEWYLMLFMQKKLEQYRNDTSKPPFLQTPSKQNHMIERLWVEINSRINYPVKQVLVEMDNSGEINMADSLHRYCVSWIAIEVLTKGAETFICSWNSHTIPGRRRGGMRSHIPNEVMQTNNRIARVDTRRVPSPPHAVRMYHEEGGRISDETYFWGRSYLC